ncbi:MAG: GTP cyclohydrolase FolE2 [Desulfohalobium sp.]
MQDVQNTPAGIPLAIDRVGVKGLRFPLLVQDREQGHQHTVSRVDMFVDLPAQFKGTHMSRFVQILQDFSGILDYPNFKNLLREVRQRLQAHRAHLSFSFPYFLRQSAPVSGSSSLLDYQCALRGELNDADQLLMFLQVQVPVMTVCPCSLAIAAEGAHSQRALITMNCRFSGMLWLEDLIHIGQNAASCQVHALLKRADEKFVTEKAFSSPTFVEDVVRNAAHQLQSHDLISWYRVEVESFESIHNHNAYACIETPSTPESGLTFSHT